MTIEFGLRNETSGGVFDKVKGFSRRFDIAGELENENW